MVVCACCDCGFVVELKVIELKRRVNKRGFFACPHCLNKRVWTSERKEQKRQTQREKWNSPEYRQHHEHALKKLRNDLECVERHKEGCKKAQTDERRRQLSAGSKKTWENPEYRQRQHESLKTLWESSEYRAKQEAFKNSLDYRKCQANRQAAIASDPEFRQNLSNKQKEVWKDSEYRENQSNKQKEVWGEPGYRDAQSNKQKRVWKNPEYRAKYEKMWKNLEYRARLSELIRQKWQEDEFKERACAASKAKWQDDEYREKMRASLISRWQKPDYRRLKFEQSKRMWEDPSYKERMGKIRAAQSGKRSSIEGITESILTQLGIEFVFQQGVGPYVFDFFLTGKNAYIECQGEYWHSLPGRQGRDAAKLSYLEKASPSAKMLYLQERNFMNPVHVSAKIREFVFGEVVEIEQVNFDFKDVTVGAVNREDASRFFNAFHYAGFGRGAKIVLGASLEGQLVAACKVAPVVRAEVATSMSMAPGEVMEIDRFCIHPSFQKKNFASWLLSRASKAAFDKFPCVKRLVSFADATHGHIGTIYRAANWIEVGRVRPDYHYVNDEGWVIHKKTLYNRAVKMGMTEREYAELHGYIKTFGKEKTKFILNV
jgi:GNAT superfamily N-acetyltransferase